MPARFATVNRRSFELKLHTHRQGHWNVETFRVAVGMVGHGTPAGEYQVIARTRTPDWLAPNSDWVPEAERGLIAPFYIPDSMKMDLEGLPAGFIPRDVKNVPLLDDSGDLVPNKTNPFEGGFISLDDGIRGNHNEGIGLHGVKFDPHLGSRASHGCIRLATDNLLHIYDLLAVGTPVVIL